MSCVPAVLGVPFLTTYRSGEVSATTFVCGKKMELGNGFTTGFVATFVKVWVVFVKPVRASSTANRSRSRKKGDSRIRCRNASKRAETAYSSRYAWFAADGGGALDRDPRPRRGETGFATIETYVLEAATPMARRWVHRSSSRVDTPSSVTLKT